MWDQESQSQQHISCSAYCSKAVCEGTALDVTHIINLLEWSACPLYRKKRQCLD